MSEIHGIIEQAKVIEHGKSELWSFKIKDEDEKLLSVDSLTRHFPEPILSEDSFTTVMFKSEDNGYSVEIKIPRGEIPASLSDIKIFEGKSTVVKFFDE